MTQNIPSNDNLLLVFQNPNIVNGDETLSIAVGVDVDVMAWISKYNDANLLVFDSDVVSIHIEKDFFIPADSATIVIERSGNNLELSKYIYTGNRVDVYLNGCLNLAGYIFDFKYDIDKDTTKITIEIKDLLEWLAQGSIFPNLGFYGVPVNNPISQLNTVGNSSGGLTNFHFPGTFTLRQCLETIVGAFTYFLNIQGIVASQNKLNYQLPALQKVFISVNDEVPKGHNSGGRGGLSLATGFAAGIRVSGKKANKYTSSLGKAIERLNTPEKGESYLDMMKRLVKLAGAYIKMRPGSVDTIVVQAPTYDRDQETPFHIIHYISPDKVNQNTVKSAHFHFSTDHQHSCVIVEGNNMSGATFHLLDEKAVVINELTGYPLVDSSQLLSGPPIAVPQVLFSLAELCNIETSGTVSPGTIASNYQVLPFNNQLYSTRQDLARVLGNIQLCMPKYEVSQIAHTTEQLAYEAAEMLAHIQDKALEFTYVVQGWNYQGAIWQPNMLVKITEEGLTPGSPINTTLWIKKVNYIKDRSQGTYCTITCTLPYTHPAEISNQQGLPISKSATPDTPSSQVSIRDMVQAFRISSGYFDQMQHPPEIPPEEPDLTPAVPRLASGSTLAAALAVGVDLFRPFSPPSTP